MGEPSYQAQQCAVHMRWGVWPVLMVRKSVPSDAYSWEWGRWRKARISEIVTVNAILMKTWRE